MSLIDSFSKPRWQHKNPEVRKTAVADLDDPEILSELVINDPEPDIRSLALARINTPGQLDRLMETLKTPLLEQARAQRLKGLLPDPSRLAETSDEETLIQIASLADSDALVTEAIGRISKPETLFDLASEHPRAAIRQSAAHRISNPDQLNRLLRHSKSRDKTVYRYCRERLDALESERAAQSAQLQQVAELVEKAAELEKLTDEVEFKGRYLLIRQQWPGLQASATEQQQEIVDAALKLGEAHQQEIDDAIAERDQQAAMTESAEQTFEDLLAQLESLDKEAPDATDEAGVARINDQLNAIEEAWVHALMHAQASDAQNNRCKALLNEWRRIVLTLQRLNQHESGIREHIERSGSAGHSDYLTLQKHLQTTNRMLRDYAWPESHSKILPEPVRELGLQRDEIQKKLEGLTARQKDNVQQLESHFESFREALSTNHFDDADREYRRLKNVMRRLGPELQHKYQNELRPLMARLNEIHDWQGFAIEPKKLGLIESMKALIGSNEDPDNLARQIKRLQSEWKQLGHLAPHRDQELWLQFKAAADEAFEPCRAAFAERAKIHEANVQRRMEVIAQLIEYESKMHWPDTEQPGEEHAPPDWKLVQKTLDTARKAVREIKPVDRRGERKTQKKLKRVCDRIYGHVRKEYERNIQLKEELVERARSLVELDDLNDAIDQAKRIQREWKEVGITPMKVDRKLWKKFRGACDGVFNRLDHQRQQRKDHISEQIKQAEGVVDKARDLLKQESIGPQLLREIRELQTAVGAIEMPSRVRQRIRAQFADIERDARKLLNDRKAQQDRQAWSTLIDVLVKSASEQGKAGSETDSTLNPDDLPAGVDMDALSAFASDGPADSDADQLRELCIALEVLYERPSPPEDKDARMAYQMQRLVDGIGSGASRNSANQVIDLLNRFIAQRPTVSWAERFCDSLKAGQAG